MTKKEIKSISIKILAILFSAELLFLVIGLFFNINKESLQTEYEKPNEVSLLYVDNNKVYKTLKVKDIFDDNNLIEDSKYGQKVYRFNEGTFEFQVEVSKAGKYMIAVDYYSENENITNTSINVYLNGNTEIDDKHKNIQLPTMWTDSSTDYLTDIYNNEVVSMQVNAQVWRTTFLYDQLYYEKNPLAFDLNASVNDIKFEINDGSVLIGAIHIYEYEEELQSYENYLESIKGKKAASDSMFIIEAEQPLYKSASDIAPASNNNAGVTPFSTSVNKLNVLSGDSFSESGSSVTYGFYVEQDGLYNISLKYFISQQNTNVYSKIYVDNEILFENLNRYGFINKKSGFKNETLNVNGDNIEFYLTKGFHTLTLQLDASLQAPIYNKLNELIKMINNIHADVIKLTNGTVDKNYVWKDLFTYLPQADDDLIYIEEEIEKLLDYITEYTKGNKDEQNALYQQIKNALGKIKQINENQIKLPQKLNVLSEGQSSCSKMLASSLHTSTFSPITIDKIYIHSADESVPKVKSNFFTGQIATFQRIFKSGVHINDDKDTINIWVNRSTYYVSLMQQYAETYYGITGQKVRFSLLPDESKIIYANASNTQPDAAFGVSSGVPYDLGIRGALVNMRELPGFNDVIQDFAPGSLINKAVGDAVYGLPETQDFQVTYYRKSFVEKNNIKIPQTYDELIEILPSLQRYNKNYYMPLAGGTGLKSIGTTAPFIYQYGGDIYSSDYMSAAIDSTAAKQAINMMVELFTIYSLPTTAQNFYQSFRDGDIPIGVSGFDMYLQVSQAAPEIQGDWDITFSPGVLQEDGTINRCYTGASREVVMFNKSDKQEATWEFIKWWLGADIQSRFANQIQQTYGATFLWNTANLEAFENLAIPKKHKDLIIKTLKEDLIQVPQIPATYIVERGISDVWNKAVFDQKPVSASISDMMIEMNKEIKRKMIEFGYLDANGEKIPGVHYYVPTVEDIKSWMEE